jgi:hypothetical protein
MADVKVVETVDAPAGAVWGLLSDFGGIAKFGGDAIEGCTVEGDGVGAVRTLTVMGGATIRERLEALDEGTRTFSYSIIGESPLPVRDYLATVQVRDEGSGCVVEWASSFEPVGAPEAAVGLIRGVYDQAISGIRKTLGA